MKGVVHMAKEKISDANKKVIAQMKLGGKQFKHLATILHVSETTARKADKIGNLLNIIEDLEQQNRMKDVQIALLQSRKKQPFKISKHM